MSLFVSSSGLSPGSREPKVQRVKSASIAWSQVWLGLPAGRFQSGGTWLIDAARARWCSSRGELRTELVVLTAVRKLKNGKAPGLCGITADMLKAIGDLGILWLTSVIKQVWQTEVIPPDWKKGIMLLILQDLFRCLVIGVPSACLGETSILEIIMIDYVTRWSKLKRTW